MKKSEIFEAEFEHEVSKFINSINFKSALLIIFIYIVIVIIESPKNIIGKLYGH